MDGSLWRFKGQGGRTISSGKEERVVGDKDGDRKESAVALIYMGSNREVIQNMGIGRMFTVGRVGIVTQ